MKRLWRQVIFRNNNHERSCVIKKLVLGLLLVTLVLSMVISIGCTTKPVEKGALRLGSLPRIFDLIAYVAQGEGLFEKKGIQVEIVSFRSTVEMNTALLSGELDGIIQDTFEAVNLNKEGKTSQLVGCAVMPRMFEVVCSPTSGIINVSDLKGKEVAVAPKTVMDYALERLVQTNGLSAGDITKVSIPSMPLRMEAVTQGKVAAAILTPPLSDLVVVSKGKVIISDSTQPFAGPGLIFSESALANNPASIGKCVEAWQETVEIINANRGKYQEMLNKVANVPQMVNLPVPEMPKLALPAESEFQSIVKWFIAQGMMSEQLKYTDVVSKKYISK